MGENLENKKEIWYFSGTGQGKYLAKELYGCWKEAEIYNITSGLCRHRMKRIVEKKDIILIYPVYASTVPEPLQQFLRELYAVNTNIVLISLWGNAHNAKGISCAYKIVRERGFHVVGAAELVAQHSCLIQSVNDSFTTERIKKVLSYVEGAFTNHRDIHVKVHKDTKITQVLCAVPKSGVIKVVTDMEFHKEQCKHCNACVSICPTLARISPEEVNEKCCIRCFACQTVCREKAIHIHVKRIAKIALAQHQKLIHEDVYF